MAPRRKTSAPVPATPGTIRTRRRASEQPDIYPAYSPSLLDTARRPRRQRELIVEEDEEDEEEEEDEEDEQENPALVASSPSPVRSAASSPLLPDIARLGLQQDGRDEDEDDDAEQPQRLTDILTLAFLAIKSVLVWLYSVPWIRRFVLVTIGYLALRQATDVARYLTPFPDHALCIFGPFRTMSAYRASVTNNTDYCEYAIKATSQDFRVDSINAALETFALIEVMTSEPVHEELQVYRSTVAEIEDELAAVFDKILPREHFGEIKDYVTDLQRSLTKFQNWAKRADFGMDSAVKVIHNDIRKLFAEMQEIDDTWSTMTRTERTRALIATLLLPNRDASTRLMQAMHSFATVAKAESKAQHFNADVMDYSYVTDFIERCVDTHRYIETEIQLRRENCQNAIDRSWSWTRWLKEGPVLLPALQVADFFSYRNMPEVKVARHWCATGRVEDKRCCQTYAGLRSPLKRAVKKGKALQGYSVRIAEYWELLGKQLEPAKHEVTQDWQPLYVFEGWRNKLEKRWKFLRRNPVNATKEFNEKHKKEGWRLFLVPREPRRGDPQI